MSKVPQSATQSGNAITWGGGTGLPLTGTTLTTAQVLGQIVQAKAERQTYDTWFRYRMREYFVAFWVDEGRPVIREVYVMNFRNLRAAIPDEYAQGRFAGPGSKGATSIKVFGETEPVWTLTPTNMTDAVAFDKAFSDWMIPQIVAERLSDGN